MAHSMLIEPLREIVPAVLVYALLIRSQNDTSCHKIVRLASGSPSMSRSKLGFLSEKQQEKALIFYELLGKTFGNSYL